MPIEEKDNKLIFFKSPHRYGYGDVLIILYSLAMICFCIYAELKPIEAPRGAFMIFALIHVLLGLYPFFERLFPIYTDTFDYEKRIFFSEKTAAFGASGKEYDFSDIADLRVKQDFDPDEPDGWYLEIELKSGAEIEVNHSFSREKLPLEDIARSANNQLKNRHRQA